MNDKSPQQDHFKNIVLEKIRKGEVRMRPKAYFILKIFLLVIIVGCIFITSFLLISFILFSIKISGKLFLLGFGIRGILLFLFHFPWQMLIAEIILIIILEWLLKNFKFGYRNSFIYILSIILSSSIMIGLLIDFTPLHKILLRRTQEKSLPIIGGFYENIQRPSEKRDVVRGTLISIEGNSLMVQADDHENKGDNGIREVITPPNLPMIENLKVGDKIFIAGDWFDNKIHAYGIKKIEPDPKEHLNE